MHFLLLVCYILLAFKGATQSKSETSHADSTPLVLVNGLLTSIKALVMHPDAIQSIDVLKGDNAVAKYGRQAKYGAIIIHAHKHIKLYRLTELMDKLNWPDSLRKYRVLVDEVLIDDPALILVQESEISMLGTTNHVDWPDFCATPTSEKFINILRRKKADQ